ncbi:unnamed protein product [Lactuca saligna]|uniref:Uncharacterized protein n=1 Tax=Lactuca saligna TaxID=75948 RepID=A0AA35ZIH8_LACSI|nr:unnamed protein product [Lactuca saligna]
MRELPPSVAVNVLEESRTLAFVSDYSTTTTQPQHWTTITTTQNQGSRASPIYDYGRFGGTMKATVLCNIDWFKPTSAMRVEASTTAVIIFCLQSDLKRYLAKRWRAKSSYMGYLCGHGWEHRRFTDASKST